MKLIYAELARIQRELKAPKNLYNSFGKYSYRNAEGILEAVKPLLNGLCLFLSDKIVHIGDRYYVEATVTLTDGEDSVCVTASAREDETKKGMDGCQITGACSSYARKYALNGLFDIDDTKDSDDDSLSPKNPKNMESTVLKDAAPAGPEFTRPAVKTEDKSVLAAKVDKVVAVPQANPITEYLVNEMRIMREARGLSASENNKLFKAQKEALIAAGLAPDKSLEEYTQQEAESLIDAMWKCFDPKGTELKTK